MEKNIENHTLLLHIGTQKTGTSSLQKFLHDNNANLIKRGWIYPQLKSDEDYNETIINGISLLSSFLQEDDETFDKNMQSILAFLKKYNVIISYEVIWNLKKKVYIPEIIIDNYSYDTNIENIPVVSANSIICWSDYHIIITCAAYQEIEKQLQKEHLKLGKDYIRWFDLSLNGSQEAKVFIYPTK